ncbi:hypothetical protein CHS0354_023526 [Potamilus streckersoni]|uniref:DNA-directed DNA polymerase n=1 Tax=Potamilus streckersoni TaxID=2493646 RepID=A0AAE0RV76_9BIVA|nr:hypothetical protein CHS0354_023526 [Potamilus streckersoni]
MNAKETTIEGVWTVFNVNAKETTIEGVWTVFNINAKETTIEGVWTVFNVNAKETTIEGVWTVFNVNAKETTIEGVWTVFNVNAKETTVEGVWTVFNVNAEETTVEGVWSVFNVNAEETTVEGVWTVFNVNAEETTVEGVWSVFNVNDEETTIEGVWTVFNVNAKETTVEGVWSVFNVNAEETTVEGVWTVFNVNAEETTVEGVWSVFNVNAEETTVEGVWTVFNVNAEETTVEGVWSVFNVNAEETTVEGVWTVFNVNDEETTVEGVWTVFNVSSCPVFMFLLMKGRTKEEAFKVGQEIADTVTKLFPKPIKLKFEKVYLPCVLETKKRYVGFSYETPSQKEPIFDAKGIETVRRDNCPAVAKILERSIKILFTTRDVSEVKSYFQRQCTKLMEGTVSVQDFIFAKEFRGMNGYKPGAYVPGLEIAKKLLKSDRRSEPRVGERIPYVIVYGSPGLPLIQLVRQPHELLQDSMLRLNATYYITKQILPPLHRFLSLLGVDVFSWLVVNLMLTKKRADWFIFPIKIGQRGNAFRYIDMPKVVRVNPQGIIGPENKKGTISQYFAASHCLICDRQTSQSICNSCLRKPQVVCVTLNDRILQWERTLHHLSQICYTCMGNQEASQPCVSFDCPILYRRIRAKQDVTKGDNLREVLIKVCR